MAVYSDNPFRFRTNLQSGALTTQLSVTLYCTQNSQTSIVLAVRSAIGLITHHSATQTLHFQAAVKVCVLGALGSQTLTFVRITSARAHNTYIYFIGNKKKNKVALIKSTSHLSDS